MFPNSEFQTEKQGKGLLLFGWGTAERAEDRTPADALFCFSVREKPGLGSGEVSFAPGRIHIATRHLLQVFLTCIFSPTVTLHTHMPSFTYTSRVLSQPFHSLRESTS